MDTATQTTTELAEYRRHYEWGWRYSGRGAANLERLDERYKNSPWHNAALDGYLDYAAGREKWHMLHCEDHDKCA